MSGFYDQLNNVPDDDISVASQADYVDGGFGLIPEATYDARILEFEPVFDDAGEFKKRIAIKKIEIVGIPEEDLRKQLGRTVNNLSVFTTRYQRNGIWVSGLGDLVRGYTKDREWQSLKDAVDIIQEAVDKQHPFQMKLIWSAYDVTGADAQGIRTMVPKSQEQKELRKKATVKGMRNFKQLPDSSYSPEVAGPISQEMLEARIELDRVVPVDKKRKMLT